MDTALLIMLSIVSVLLIIFILMQQMSSGMGGALGMSGSGGGSYQSRRGAEKLLYRGTIVLITIFILGSLAYLVIINS